MFSLLDKDTITTILQPLITKLNLCTREEFDIQAKILSRCQKRIKELESKLEKVEQKF